jgi:hypothetical protein
MFVLSNIADKFVSNNYGTPAPSGFEFLYIYIR